MKLTPDTITDEQIRELEGEGRKALRAANKLIAAAVATLTEHRGQRAARARCAEILNARSAK